MTKSVPMDHVPSLRLLKSEQLEFLARVTVETLKSEGVAETPKAKAFRVIAYLITLDNGKKINDPYAKLQDVVARRLQTDTTFAAEVDASIARSMGSAVNQEGALGRLARLLKQPYVSDEGAEFEARLEEATGHHIAQFLFHNPKYLDYVTHMRDYATQMPAKLSEALSILQHDETLSNEQKQATGLLAMALMAPENHYDRDMLKALIERSPDKRSHVVQLNANDIEVFGPAADSVIRSTTNAQREPGA
jgi:hypothetical protein